MKVWTKSLCLAVGCVVLSLPLAGCGGPDNEKTMNTNADGTPASKSEPPPNNPQSSDDAYKAMMKNQKSTYGGYGKKR